MAIKVAINGYGRIGRDFHRQTLKTDDIQVVAINSRAGADSHAHLLKYDSVYGRCDADIKVVGSDLEINGSLVKVFQQKDVIDLNWGELGVQVVVESTGKYTTYEKAEDHLKAGAEKVLVTAPCKDDRVKTIVMGINDQENNPDDYKIVSNASCTTNCLAPILKVLNESFGIESAFATTVHAFTNNQNLHDNSHSDLRRARSTVQNLIPTTTGAMKAISKVLPELNGKIEGMALRIPLACVSMIDVTAYLQKSVSEDEVNKVFKEAEESGLRGKLGTCDEPLVSSDFKGDTRSAIIDMMSTKVVGDKFVKVMAWYDNEWGYGARVIDLLRWLGS